MSEQKLLLHAEKIDKKFGPTHAVKEVSLDFYEGPKTRSTRTTTASPSSSRRSAPCPASPSPRTCSWATRTSSSRTASRTPAP